MEDNNSKTKIKEHLANEQTFLAWLRTGIEVIVFGFVAIKFSLFAAQVGIALLCVGTLMILLSYLRYRKTVRQFRDNEFRYSTLLATITAVIILLLSTVLIAYLIHSHLQGGNLPNKI